MGNRLKALCISEKPSVSAELEKAYNKIKDNFKYDVDFASAAGHLVALFDPNEYKPEWGTPWRKDVLPIVPDKWQTKVINSKFYNHIKDMWQSKNYDVIINAGDAGREGQLIQELIYRSIGMDKPVLRFWADDTTEKTIIKALNNLRPNEEYQGLTDASILRMYFDWLLGINYSRSASLSLNRASNLGRVMTPTLAMIVNRENEIRSFKPVSYYELEVLFKYKNESFKGTLLNPAPLKNLVPTAYLERGVVEDIYKNLDSKGVISEVEEKEKISNAPTLFNLSDLQKEMANKYHYSPATTLDIAESLYMKKYLSYPRTESKCMSSSQALEMNSLLDKLKAIPGYSEIITSILSDQDRMMKVLSSKKYVDDKKVKDHPALMPTDEIPDIDNLNVKERNVYIAVLQRILAIFLPPNIILQTSVIIDVGENRFKATGNVVKELGWKSLYKNEQSDSPLPPLKEGDEVSTVSREIKDKETTPPKRYTNATILTAMETAGKQLDDEELEKVLNECAGLGTPATRAEILGKLEKKDYISISSKGIISPTDQGTELIRALEGQDVISPELTAKWEKKLRQVEEGTVDFDTFYKYMVAYVSKKTVDLSELKAIGPYFKIIGKCPKCKERDFLSLGNYYCCKGFITKDVNGERECSFALPSHFGGVKGENGKFTRTTALSETDIKDLISGLPTKVKKFTWSDGKTSSTSLILDSDCKIAFPKKKSLGKCPVCGGDVYQGKKGGFYCQNVLNKDENKCTFLINPTLGRTVISDVQLSEILKNGETDKEVRITLKNGEKSKYPAKIIIEHTEQFGWHFTFKRFAEEDIGKCPVCEKGRIIKKIYSYNCNNPNCDVKLSRNYFDNEITSNEAISLISGKEIKKKVNIKKDGKSNIFETTLYMEKHIDGYYNIKYIPSKRKK